ncbi:hypothetical protein [Streptomyces sp. MBT62]|uniref:hypothetical protein n=1 Tax=Streptomyces sp. MBT62 TaxID=2800410 RepID=UPI00190D68D9|nr:hypothetical protein [Streptomyces sp. MBT62]MBK3571507.1 hypothetical protein [Streptomyces sp. MBT62]
MTAMAMSPTTARPQRAVLRLHRPASIVWGAFVLLAVGALLWVHLFRAPSARHPVDPYFVMTDVNNVMNFLGEVLSYTSVAVAAWAGAALVGRELENGAARFAWTQSLTPARWLTAQLGAAALPLTGGTTLLGLVYAWVWTADQDVLVTDWSYDRVLVPAGPMAVALPLFALAVGALAGVATGRALPALAMAAAITWTARSFFGSEWDTVWPLRRYWPVELSATAALLLLTALALAAAYTLLGRLTNIKGAAV